jgi:hypothetical protein
LWSSAAVGDPGDLLDVEMDQLTRLIALMAHNRLGVGGSVSRFEPGEPFGGQDRLHRSSCTRR